MKNNKPDTLNDEHLLRSDDEKPRHGAWTAHTTPSNGLPLSRSVNVLSQISSTCLRWCSMIERSSIRGLGEPTNAVHTAWFFLHVGCACPIRVIAAVIAGRIHGSRAQVCVPCYICLDILFNPQRHIEVNNRPIDKVRKLIFRMIFRPGKHTNTPSQKPKPNAVRRLCKFQELQKKKCLS
jgi:hypothetical protein